MQKNKHNASILIWSIFLSLILSISFVSISSKINQNIRDNQKYISKNTNNYLIQDKIKNKDYTNETFTLSNEKIIFMQNKDYSWSLKKSENIKIKFEQITDISINIIEGWPISYITSWTLTSSWLIISSSSLSLSGSIILTNLAWYTVYNIISNNNIIAPFTKYKIIKTIWNKDILKTRWIIQNN